MREPSPVEVVQEQLEAYNLRDIEVFLELFAEDATVWDLGATAPTLVGRGALRERYTDLFARSPALHSHLVSRIAFGRVVVDLEQVSGRESSSELFEVLAIYEVVAGKIQRVHFVRKS
jgi:hypothetical protein